MASGHSAASEPPPSSPGASSAGATSGPNTPSPASDRWTPVAVKRAAEAALSSPAKRPTYSSYSLNGANDRRLAEVLEKFPAKDALNAGQVVVVLGVFAGRKRANVPMDWNAWSTFVADPGVVTSLERVCADLRRLSRAPFVLAMAELLEAAAGRAATDRALSQAALKVGLINTRFAATASNLFDGDVDGAARRAEQMRGWLLEVTSVVYSITSELAQDAETAPSQ